MLSISHHLVTNDNGNRWTLCKQLWNKLKDKIKDTPSSHFLLDGGIFKFPENINESFYKIYTQSLENGERNFIHEQRSDPQFPFYLDLDIYLIEPLTDLEEKEIIESIIDKLKLFVNKEYQDEKLFFIAATPKYQKQLDSEGKRFKYGMHLHFPYFILNGAFASEIVLFLQDKLTPHRKFENTWTKIIDKEVYSNNNNTPKGLRMIGSRKAETCECETGCDVCEYKKKKDLGRAYWPKYISTPLRFELTTLNLVRHCSVKRLVEIPEIDSLFTIYRRPSNWRKPSQELPRPPPQSESWIILDKMDPIYQVIAKQFELYPSKSSYPFQKQIHAKVLGIKVHPSGSCYIVNVNSKKCANILNKTEHNRSNVYFMITSHHLIQKCFSHNEEDRKEGPCNKWKGHRYPLPTSFYVLVTDIITNMNRYNQIPNPVLLEKIKQQWLYRVSEYNNILE